VQLPGFALTPSTHQLSYITPKPNQASHKPQKNNTKLKKTQYIYVNSELALRPRKMIAVDYRSLDNNNMILRIGWIAAAAGQARVGIEAGTLVVVETGETI
jgi:hypothetical protein